MRLKQFILTRFSYRMAGTARLDDLMGTEDPLEPKRLEARFKLFELFCLPSVLSQRVKDCSWIVIVDPALSQRHRDRLRELCSAHSAARIIDYSEGRDVGGLRWLAGDIEHGTTHVSTTNMDDDDLVSVDYLERVRAHLTQLDEAGRLPSCQIIGCDSYAQWDFMPMSAAPFGYLKPWSRGRFLTNAGLTFFCAYPEYDASALCLRHRRARAYFDVRRFDSDAALDRLRAGATAAGDDWSAWTPDAHVHSLGGSPPCIAVVNHIGNLQAARLFETPTLRTVVRGPQDFPGMAVDFDHVRRTIADFRCSPAIVAGIAMRALKSAWTADRVSPRRRFNELRRALKIPVQFAHALLERAGSRPRR